MFEKLKYKIKHMNPKIFFIFTIVIIVFLLVSLIFGFTYFTNLNSKSSDNILQLKIANEKVKKEYEELKSQDQ